MCYYPTFVSSRWLAVRLEFIGNLVILFASLFAVLTRAKMDPGTVGLSLSYALTITNRYEAIHLINVMLRCIYREKKSLFTA